MKREEEEARAKQRAMDGAGVARDPNVRATADGARCCSNPTCVAREDTLGSGRSMLRCSRCKSARYCSTHCQRTHWRDGHKGKCVAPGEATAKETPAAAAPPAPSNGFALSIAAAILCVLSLSLLRVTDQSSDALD